MTNVWYAVVKVEGGRRKEESDSSAFRLPPSAVSFIPLAYDHHRLAGEMRAEQLPEEFIETILTGWWTSCLGNPAEQGTPARTF